MSCSSSACHSDGDFSTRRRGVGLPLWANSKISCQVNIVLPQG
ncbi:CxxxxCH/CxxCH domain-containing protein [Pseudoalteromonas sp. SCSIO 43101]